MENPWKMTPEMYKYIFAVDSIPIIIYCEFNAQLYRFTGLCVFSLSIPLIFIILIFLILYYVPCLS